MPRRLAAIGCLGLSGLGLVLALAWLVAGGGVASLAIPIGLPGVGMALALDGLSGWFLALLMAVGLAASAAALADAGEGAASEAFLFVLLGAMALAVLAADAFALAFGVELATLASVALLLGRQEDPGPREAALRQIAVALPAAACLIVALALLAGGVGWDLRFAAIRAHPPQGWQATAVLALTLVGAGSRAGLAPLHGWLPPAHAAAPPPASALLGGAMPALALYLLVRVLFDLCGPAQPPWWGVPLLVVGPCGAVLGMLRANAAGDIKEILACSTVGTTGLIASGLGVALAARGADLPSLASLALAGSLLGVLAHGLVKPLLVLGAGAVQQAAGSRRLSRLGGLIQCMPITTACMLVGAASWAALPPTAGFAGFWTLFEAMLGGSRAAGAGLQILIAVVAGLAALAVALAALAAVRLIGVALLGRPRWPRTLAAEEVGLPLRVPMLGLAAASLLVGLFPGAALALMAPALRRLVGADLADRAGWLALAPQGDMPGYSAIGIAALAGLAAALAVGLIRWRGASGARIGPAWDGGFDAPPTWLPFGDPLTQPSGAGFAQPVLKWLGTALLRAKERLDTPAPGEVRPARIATEATDPVDRAARLAAAALRTRASAAADRMPPLTGRGALALLIVVLALVLVAVTVWGQP